jgi:hypothetical protein
MENVRVAMYRPQCFYYVCWCNASKVERSVIVFTWKMYGWLRMYRPQCFYYVCWCNASNVERSVIVFTWKMYGWLCTDLSASTTCADVMQDNPTATTCFQRLRNRFLIPHFQEWFFSCERFFQINFSKFCHKDRSHPEPLRVSAGISGVIWGVICVTSVWIDDRTNTIPYVACQ